MKAIAHDTVDSILREKGKGVGETFTLYDTDPDEPSLLFSI